MSNILDIPQNFSTTLNVGGGIDNSQTTSIALTSVTGLPTDGGILAFDWANPINTATIEYIEYGSLSSNTLAGVVRGQEGYTAVAHANGATVVGVVSRAHIKRLKDNFTAEHDRSTGAHSTTYVVTPTATQTLTNKRRTRRVVTVTQSATPTINTDNTDVASITGLAQAITSMTTNLSGTPVDGDLLEVRITDNGSARAITWGASFQSSGTVTLPSTTVLSTMLRVGFEWDSTASKWTCIATA